MVTLYFIWPCSVHMHIHTTSQKSLNSNIFNGFFVFKSLLLTKPAFIWSKVQQKQYNLEKFYIWIYFTIHSVHRSNLFLWFKSWFFYHYYSHNSSEINLICRSKNIYYYYVENSGVYFLQVSLMNRKFKRTAFIWNRNRLWRYKCLYHHFNINLKHPC